MWFGLPAIARVLETDDLVETVWLTDQRQGSTVSPSRGRSERKREER